MVGRTNALVRALVSSVNGMSGVVVLNANIAYDDETTYESGTIGAELQNHITSETIDSLYGEIIPPPDPEPEPEPEPEESSDEETPAEEPVEETVEETEEQEEPTE